MPRVVVRLYRETPEPSTIAIRVVSSPSAARKFLMAYVPVAAVPGGPALMAPMVFRRHSAERLSLTLFMFVTTVSSMCEVEQRGRAVRESVSSTIPVQWIPYAARRSENTRRVYQAGSLTLIRDDNVSRGL